MEYKEIKLNSKMKEELDKESIQIRREILDLVYNAKSGHIGGSFSSVEILNILFKYFLKKEDILIISKAHITPLVYVLLTRYGKLSSKELEGFRTLGSKLEGHVKKGLDDRIIYSAGSLGQGLSVANGIAIANKYDEVKGNVYCLLGDGEMQEGQIWEAFMTAVSKKLNNIIILIDKNNYQLDGSTEDVKISIPNETIASLGIKTYEVDGHNADNIVEAYNIAVKHSSNKDSLEPLAFVFNTVKGKGVSFMENTNTWHGKVPTESEYAKALKELQEVEGGNEKSN